MEPVTDYCAVTQEMWDEVSRYRLFPGDRNVLRDAIGYALEHVKRRGGNAINAQLTAERLEEILRRTHPIPQQVTEDSK